MRGLVLTTLAALSAGVTTEPEARPKRPPKTVEHYTFPSGYIDEKIRPYASSHDRVIVSNELVTMVTEGEPICRITWRGRRVDALIAHEGRLEIFVPLPRGASIEEVEAYLVDKNGRDGRKVEGLDLSVQGDSLLVLIPDVGDARVVDLQYRFEGEGISVDESFLFQPEVPVLKAEYRFSVSRELWQAAADAGLTWEFSATAVPRTWNPARDDSPDFFSWYWRDYSLEPIETESDRSPKSITVTGYLPAPILAGLNEDELPDVNQLEDILDFTASLVSDYQSNQQQNDYGGGSGALRDRYAGSDAGSVPTSVGKGSR